MTDPKREQHPLLCDEYSDEEFRIQDTSPSHTRRLHTAISYSGRARYHVKGAAAIIKRWPDHMSSLLTYWWMGLAMIGVTVFIIYNSVIAVTIVPPHPKYNKMLDKENVIDDKKTENTSHKHNVYMHLVIAENETIDTSYYLSYIEIISKKYHAYQYNLLVLINDTLKVEANLSDYENNEIAMNSLWRDKNIKMKSKSYDNVHFRFKLLSEFMNKSPLRKHWRRLPNKFLPFFVRCISIWNNGGVSINPTLLTPESPNPNYIKKVKNILELNKISKYVKKVYKKDHVHKSKKKVNNIRDIIEALENDNSSKTDQHLVLDEEENEAVTLKVNVENYKNSPNFPIKSEILKSNTDINNVKKKSVLRRQTRNSRNIFNNTANKSESRYNTNGVSNQEDADSIRNNTDYPNLFPTFLKYIFPNSNWTNSYGDNAKKQQQYINNTILEIIKPDNNSSKDIDKKFVRSISEKTLRDAAGESVFYNKRYGDLSIDLKGNIVATMIPCHAFLGTIFNNAIHYIREETITDLIISEISVFCKGLWSSCNGVDVVLL